MTAAMFYNLHEEPCDPDEAARLLADEGILLVARSWDDDAPNVRVETNFTVVNRNFDPGQEPFLYLTTARDDKGVLKHVGYASTRSQAIDKHQQIAAKLGLEYSSIRAVIPMEIGCIAETDGVVLRTESRGN